MAEASEKVTLRVRVENAAHFSGQTERWSGESVRIKREYASRVQTRSLNRPKTYLAAGAAVAGLVVFTKAFGLFGFATEQGDPAEPPPPQSSRGWWP